MHKTRQACGRAAWARLSFDILLDETGARMHTSMCTLPEARVTETGETFTAQESAKARRKQKKKGKTDGKAGGPDAPNSVTDITPTGTPLGTMDLASAARPCLAEPRGPALAGAPASFDYKAAAADLPTLAALPKDSLGAVPEATELSGEREAAARETPKNRSAGNVSVGAPCCSACAS